MSHLEKVIAERLRGPHRPTEEGQRYRVAALRALYFEPELISARGDKRDPGAVPGSRDLYPLRGLGSRSLENSVVRRHRRLVDFLIGITLALIGVVAVAVGWLFG